MGLMFRKNQQRISIMLLGLTAMILNSVALAQTEVASAQKDELWQKGSKQALANNFGEAARTFDQLVKIDPQDMTSREALEWAQSAVTLSQDRETMRARSYDGHLARAQKLME